jgi:hypothetical protein
VVGCDYVLVHLLNALGGVIHEDDFRFKQQEELLREQLVPSLGG